MNRQTGGVCSWGCDRPASDCASCPLPKIRELKKPRTDLPEKCCAKCRHGKDETSFHISLIEDVFDPEFDFERRELVAKAACGYDCRRMMGSNGNPVDHETWAYASDAENYAGVHVRPEYCCVMFESREGSSSDGC